jgi:AMP-binding enzyme
MRERLRRRARFRDVPGVKVVQGYGLTEAGPITHLNPVHDDALLTLDTAGPPVNDTEQRVVDLETGARVLASGEVGEVCVRGPQLMLGYWNAPDASAAALRGGWLYTGDIGRIDARGYLTITDRKKEMIGKPDPEAGEVPKAFVVRATPFRRPRRERSSGASSGSRSVSGSGSREPELFHPGSADDPLGQNPLLPPEPLVQSLDLSLHASDHRVKLGLSPPESSPGTRGSSRLHWFPPPSCPAGSVHCSGRRISSFAGCSGRLRDQRSRISAWLTVTDSPHQSWARAWVMSSRVTRGWAPSVFRTENRK